MLVAGSVSIDQVTGAETTSPGLGTDLYLARKAVSKLPDPANKRGCTTTAILMSGATTMAVDTSAGYAVGDPIGEVQYVSGTSPAEVSLVVESIPDGTHLTFSPAIPVGVSAPLGTKFGFRGTQPEWSAAVTTTLVKIKTALAAQAMADATTLIAYFTANTEVLLSSVNADVTPSIAGLQRTPDPNNPNTATQAPTSTQSIPLVGTGTIQ